MFTIFLKSKKVIIIAKVRGIGAGNLRSFGSKIICIGTVRRGSADSGGRGLHEPDD